MRKEVRSMYKNPEGVQWCTEFKNPFLGCSYTIGRPVNEIKACYELRRTMHPLPEIGSSFPGIVMSKV